MENTQALGDLKSTHSPSKTFIYFAIAVCIVFTGISGMIYFGGIVSVQEGRSHFAGDLSILYWCIVFIMGLAAVILITALVLSKGKTYHLYEQGIVIQDKDEKKTLLFKDIDDLYLFRSGKSFITNNIAFRNRAEDQWEVITARYRKVSKAIEFITTQHESIKVPLLLKQLENGLSVTFQYITYGTALSRQLFSTGTKSFLKVQPKEIIVYKDQLVIDSKQIMTSTISRFEANDWISQISLYTKDNNVVFSTSTNGIFSGLTFITLLDKLVNSRK